MTHDTSTAHVETPAQMALATAHTPPQTDAQTDVPTKLSTLSTLSTGLSALPPVEVPILDHPADGIPPIIDTDAALEAAIEALQAGSGPVAIDAERAQSFRYSAKAYLIQLRRAGAGTLLIDPETFERPGEKTADLSRLSDAIVNAEWIIHAAIQDLPCLALIGLRPKHLFDTELAGRLLGLPKVGLGAMVEEYCGVRLLKEHSAADWSIRPIAPELANYAALDVELLSDLRNQLAVDLERAGKSEWARQEFEMLAANAWLPALPRPDRWRRTSGSHVIKSARGLALVRELWTVRDQLANELDKAPSKVLQDQAITDLASLVKIGDAGFPTPADLRRIDGFKRREARKHVADWNDALERVRLMGRSQWPPLKAPHDGPPQPRAWQRVRPAAYERWQRVRPAVNELAERLNLPPENLLSPDILRKLTWKPPATITPSKVAQQLEQLGARRWQQELLSDLLARELLG